MSDGEVKNQKHTPGPWRVGKSNAVVADHPTSDDANSGHADVEYYGGHLVCESVWKKSDANLIASAPDLLEALIVIRDEDDDMKMDGRVGMHRFFRAMIDGAIAKATGEEPQS